MTALAVETVVAKLSDAGLNLSLAPAGGLAVTPSSHLTADLRELIRSSKALLIDWLTASNEVASHVPDPPDNPLDWKELTAAYHAHHFSCPICIAAGRGPRYGQRCGAGMALWREYCD
ncbi:MAG: hypothetical protein KBF66_18980 [Rhodoferax sp.]|uniref:hypothetical protein n=1 Tax=Rhodoferax sp. TaxID=50421 RepID=UPI001B76B0FB|nr:hypothetical protein [Rhodoferax sp.]MBP9907635.1 hypothetical protein [Rhodoferax sp.]